jgi:arylsulfatase A-like enzyme
VIVLTDDLGYGDVSHLNPGAKVKTPHIDARAGTGDGEAQLRLRA